MTGFSGLLKTHIQVISVWGCEFAITSNVAFVEGLRYYYKWTFKESKAKPLTLQNIRILNHYTLNEYNVICQLYLNKTGQGQPSKSSHFYLQLKI